MKNPNHQTVKLERGKHFSPREGVCVMELASMLAGEIFSDHPYCVSPAIGGFLRAYNDAVDDRLRQDLYRLASAVVGTRSTPEVEELRVRRIVEWGRNIGASRRLWRLATSLRRFPAFGDNVNPDEAGSCAVRAIGGKHSRTHADALALVEELIALRPPLPPRPPLVHRARLGRPAGTRALGVTRQGHRFRTVTPPTPSSEGLPPAAGRPPREPDLWSGFEREFAPRHTPETVRHATR